MNAERGYGLLILAVLCVSVGSIFVRLAGAPALAVAFNRIFLASVVVAPFAAPSLVRAWPALTARRRLVLLASGISLGVHFATWIASLSYTSVAASVLLVNTAPLFTLFFSWWFLGERATKAVLIAMAVALTGAALIAAGDWGDGGAASLKGDALAVAGAVTLSLYHVIGRGLRDALPLPAYVLGVWSTAAATLAVLAATARVPVFGYPPRTFALFLALAVVPTVIGHGLVNRSLRHIPAPTVGLFLLGEPIAASILAYAVFGETPGALTLAGGVLVLAALALVVRSEGE
ncbi:MAG TPA: DMT family transporter [Vicinamibacteria bacterium]|nr:DMT family transporter [Vicinamibacteria bacterium]